jgi:RNA polymerase sigma-70 factor (ECF subfamily)
VPPEEDLSDAGRAALVRLVRNEGARVLATLTRTCGSLETAEDAVQDATVRALEVWGRSGIPDEPRAWLTSVARNRAVDILRREARREGKEWSAELVASDGQAPVPGESEIADDLLRLIFTCCHPALSLETQTALALHTLCGLTNAEVGRALLVSEATMAKRLTRARRKIAVANIPYRTPTPDEMPERLEGVLSTIYLLFNEGYNATGGDPLMRQDLMNEAIRLGRLLRELLPTQFSTTGLLALMLLQSSRTAARLDETGEIVLLEFQDREKWDHAALREGMSLLGEALRWTPTHPDLYATQAAIAACHALARSWETTNWAAIVSWYDVLLEIYDTPVVRLNRAVALGELIGPQAGLDAVDTISSHHDLGRLAAVRGEFLYRLGRYAEAGQALETALAQSPTNNAQRRHLECLWVGCTRATEGPTSDPDMGPH